MSIEPLELFYKDVDIFLENLFMGGLVTADKQSSREQEELITEAKNFDLAFLAEQLENLQNELTTLMHSTSKDTKRATQTYYLLCEYITLTLRETALIKIEEAYL